MFDRLKETRDYFAIAAKKIESLKIEAYQGFKAECQALAKETKSQIRIQWKEIGYGGYLDITIIPENNEIKLEVAKAYDILCGIDNVGGEFKFFP